MNILYIDGNRGTDLSKKEGYYTHITQLVLALRKLGHNVKLISISKRTNIPELKDEGIFFVKHRYLRGIHKILPYIGFINSIHIFVKSFILHRKYNFEVIHDRFGLYSFGGILLSKFLRIPLVLEINGPVIEEKALFTVPIQGSQLSVAKMIRKFCVSNADAIYVVSKIVKEYVLTWTRKKKSIFIIPNGANPEWFKINTSANLIRKSLGWSANKIYITYTGSLHIWYDLITLIKAVKSIKNNIPYLNLMIIGDGQQKEELIDLVNKYSIEDRIYFLGHINRSEISLYLIASDILIAPYKDLPTGFFGSPIKIFEYMLSGTPLIASNLGQISEIINNDENGLLYRPGDLGELTSCLIKLAKNSELRKKIGSNARKDAENNYTWNHVAQKLISIYKKIQRK